MNDPLHQQRLAEIREEYLRWVKAFRAHGSFEQQESQPRGGHTWLRFRVRRGNGPQQAALDRAMWTWSDEHFAGDDRVRFTANNYFIVKRSKCVHCGKQWYDHTPSGGQCLFMSTKYLEFPRAALRAYRKDQILAGAVDTP